MCGDPRCKSFGVPTGTFTLHPQSDDVFLISAVGGQIIPCSSILSIYIELMTGVKGGNSASYNFGMSDGVSTAVDAFSVTCGDSLKSKLKFVLNSSKKIAFFLSVVGAIKDYGYTKLDNIAFGLMSTYGISTTFNSVEKAENTMFSLYAYIGDNPDYFSTKIDTISTLYELDQMLYKSNNPQKIIDSRVKNFGTKLYASGIFGKQHKFLTDTLRDTLSDYQNRISEIGDDIKEVLK